MLRLAPLKQTTTTTTRRFFSSTNSRSLVYGFIGLGRMGYPMAANLQASLDSLPTSVPDLLSAPESSPNKLVVFDISKENPQKLADTNSNTEIANSVGEVAEKADVIVSMLPEPKHVDGVYKEIIGHLKPSKSGDSNKFKKVFIDSSTIDVTTSKSVGEMLKPFGYYFVDAPVSGGVVGATNGTLTFMLGNPGPKSQSIESKLYDAVLSPVISKMGAKIVPCGDVGLGLAAKLANNYLLALTNIATSESFQIAKNLGLDMELYSSIVDSSSGQSWSSTKNNPVPGLREGIPSSRDYLNGFGVGLMKKDLGLALDAARDAKLPLLLGQDAYRVYDEVSKDEYCSNRDMAVIYKYIEKIQETKK